MTFFSYFSDLISNFYSPFRNLLKINDICKSGFYKNRLFYYSLIIHIMAIISITLSGWIVKSNSITGYSILITNLIISILADFIYIFLSFSILHFLKIKIDFENLSILYFVSSYFYIILFPITVILNAILKEKNSILSSTIFLCFYVIGFLMKIKAYSIVTAKSMEKGLLYYILPLLFLLLFFMVLLINIYFISFSLLRAI